MHRGGFVIEAAVAGQTFRRRDLAVLDAAAKDVAVARLGGFLAAQPAPRALAAAAVTQRTAQHAIARNALEVLLADHQTGDAATRGLVVGLSRRFVVAGFPQPFVELV